MTWHLGHFVLNLQLVKEEANDTGCRSIASRLVGLVFSIVLRTKKVLSRTIARQKSDTAIVIDLLLMTVLLALQTNFALNTHIFCAVVNVVGGFTWIALAGRSF